MQGLEGLRLEGRERGRRLTQVAKPRKRGGGGRHEQSEEERDPCRQHSLKQHSGDRPGDRSQDEGQGLLQPHSCQGELQAL